MIYNYRIKFVQVFITTCSLNKVKGIDVFMNIENFEDDLNTTEWIEKSEKKAKFKLRIRKKMLFPIIKDNKLFVYRITGTEKTNALESEYSDTLYDTQDVVTNDEKILNDFRFRFSISSYFINLVHHHISTKEDLYRYYELDKIENRYSFLNLPQNKIFKIDKEMEFDDIIEAMSKYYFTFIFKEPSKISQIISFVSGYLDVDYIASNIYNYLYSNCKNFSFGLNPLEEEQMKIDRMCFTNKERNMSIEDKFSLIKDVFESFNIECVYSSKIDEMNDFITSSVFGTKSKEMVLEFAQHNTDLIYNSEFSPIFERIIASKEKVLKLYNKKD